MIDFGAFTTLSFDCYGTLIDWETGILRVLEPMLARHAVHVDPRTLLEAFARLESAAEAGPYVSYATVLEHVTRGLGDQYGFVPDDGEARALAASIGDWPPFPDTGAALRALASRYRLAILSNIDDDLFEKTARRLGVDFAWVITAAQVKSYKPGTAHFTTALERFGVGPEKVLHAAQSLFHDVAPARALGIATVWVNRRRGLAGAGATPPSGARPDLEVPDLATLARLAGVS